MCYFLSKKTIISLFFSFFIVQNSIEAQVLNKKDGYTHQDTLRGSLGSGRTWWDIQHYDIELTVDIDKKYIYGYNDIEFSVVGKSGKQMQIDLQMPMVLSKVEDPASGKTFSFTREGNVYWVNTSEHIFKGKKNTLRFFYSGNPTVAVTPPWDGGWIFKKDEKGRPYVSTAVQGIGASLWLPCKDHQSDEPDNGMNITMNVPNDLVAVSNGRLSNKKDNKNGTTGWTWTVKNPINSYLITPYIGHYVNFTDTLMGEKGKLDLSYWVLDYNLEKAKKHFEIVKPMLHCFEYWMGPYPFYEDSYKLVDAPHLGMEHQSAVAYGNKYMDGYMGSDRSGTGWGKDWDFIIVHETGHEWYANNITTNDIADMWVHEGFTTYSETLFVTCKHGKQAGNEYLTGQRRLIRNDAPLIGHYCVNKEGSSDMYDKGATLVHTIRQLINDDTKFRNLLRSMNRYYYHQTTTSESIEKFISKTTGIKLKKVFDQYLRTTKVPTLTYAVKNDKVYYHWSNCVPGFNMPVKLNNGKWLYPSQKIKSAHTSILNDGNLVVDSNFYIKVEKK